MSYPELLPPIVLASESPRRKQLLTALGIQFTVDPPATDEETGKAESIEEITVRNAYKKAASVVPRLANPKSILIGADTLVVKGNDVLGKPKDAVEVHRTLRKLSGVTHEVVTGLVLLSPELGCRQATMKSYVTFRPISDEEIETYSKTREPYDKAGAYAVQGLGMLFIERIDGSYTNVMGLPLEKFLTELELLSKIPLRHWFAP